MGPLYEALYKAREVGEDDGHFLNQLEDTSAWINEWEAWNDEGRKFDEPAPDTKYRPKPSKVALREELKSLGYGVRWHRNGNVSVWKRS